MAEKRDYCEVLGRRQERQRRRNKEGLSQGGHQVPPGQESGRQGGRREVQGGRGGLRRAVEPRQAGPLRPVRPCRHERGRRRRRRRFRRFRRRLLDGGHLLAVRRHLRRPLRRRFPHVGLRGRPPRQPRLGHPHQGAAHAAGDRRGGHQEAQDQQDGRLRPVRRLGCEGQRRLRHLFDLQRLGLRHARREHLLRPDADAGRLPRLRRHGQGDHLAVRQVQGRRHAARAGRSWRSRSRPA